MDLASLPSIFIRFVRNNMDKWNIYIPILLVFFFLKWFAGSYFKPEYRDSPKQLIPSSSKSSRIPSRCIASSSRRNEQCSKITRSSTSPCPPHKTKGKAMASHIDTDPQHCRTEQPYDAFLVLDIEATCERGSGFDYPNEIIEFPVCLMRWKDKTDDDKASQLEIIDEFRSFVRPSWQPVLSQFCMELTGITQTQVDSAPYFADVLEAFRKFLVKHHLIDNKTGDRLARFCWCTDGPFDIRDFVVKQCFISKVTMPDWIKGDVLDVRMTVMRWLTEQATKPWGQSQLWSHSRRRSLNIPSQLKALGLAEFEGRQHSGIDDSRNIARMVQELARRDVCLLPNTQIHSGRRWKWMGKLGEILEDRLT